MNKIFSTLTFFLVFTSSIFAADEIEKGKIDSGNFLDFFNNCDIDETKEIEISDPSDPYNPIKYQYCNFLFTKKKYEVYNVLTNYSIWPHNNELTKQVERFFKSFRKDIFDEYDKIYTRFSLAFFRMYIIANPENNKIEFLKLYLDNGNAKSLLFIKDASEDLCFDAISKFIVTFSNKHNLKKNKWKEFSEKYKTNKNYPSGNPVFTYQRGYKYSLSSNKEVVIQCKYIPNLKKKNFYWNTEIYFTNSKFYKKIFGKSVKETTKLPKLNLKIIWKEITKQFFS